MKTKKLLVIGLALSLITFAACQGKPPEGPPPAASPAITAETPAGEQPKAILPGNHDGLLFGIFNHDLLTDYLKGDVLEWQRGCRPAAEDEDVPPSSDGRGPALNKRMFIQKYIEFQAEGPNYVFGLQSARKVKDLRDIQLAWFNPDPEGFVERIDANLVFGRDYATSFIVQKFARAATSPRWSSTPRPSASITPRPTWNSIGS